MRLKSVSQKSRGFTLLYAIIIMGLIGVVSSSVYVIMTRQLTAANASRQSELAYYAAEAALECGLYNVYDGTFTGTGSATFKCDEADITVTKGTNMTFPVTFSGVNTCATITINTTARTVNAKGYNTCSASRIRVERELTSTY